MAGSSPVLMGNALRCTKLRSKGMRSKRNLPRTQLTKNKDRDGLTMADNVERQPVAFLCTSMRVSEQTKVRKKKGKDLATSRGR